MGGENYSNGQQLCSWLEDAETWMSALELDPTAEVEQEEEEEVRKLEKENKRPSDP